jgi:predicted Ser/Thr protein kinase
MDEKSDSTLRVGPPSGADELLSPGTAVGDHVVEGPLATGGHGIVYSAVHRGSGRRAALKVLRGDVEDAAILAARFVREARVVNLVRHPNIVEIHDVGVLPDGRPYYVMEFLEGRSLDALIRELAPLDPSTTLSYLEPVCEALEAAHFAGVVHRDVKASNVMVVEEGPAPCVKLVDFGIAKHDEPGMQGLTRMGERLGTTQAMSPEQIRGGAVDGRTDVYGLGVLLFRMLTGQYPFAAEDRSEVERMHLEAAPPRPSQLAAVPPQLDSVVQRCLEKEPAGRYPTVAAFLEALRAASGRAPAGEGREIAAVAIHAVIRAARDDDDALALQAFVADAVEVGLREAGFAVPVATTGAILGVLPLPGAGPGVRPAVQEALALGRRLQEDGETTPGIRVQVTVHVAPALARLGPDGLELSGGPACRPADWVVDETEGFHATPAAREAGSE